jgi:hypothetical protein
MKKDAIPTNSVMRPSRRKSHLRFLSVTKDVARLLETEAYLQPCKPFTPSKWKKAKASREVMTVVALRVVQK